LSIRHPEGSVVRGAVVWRRRAEMYSTVRRYEGVTDSAEAARRVADGFIPLLKTIPGFVSYYFIDAGAGVMASVSVFEDRAGAEASNDQAAGWVADNLADLVTSPPTVTPGEVVAHT
jgi:hypothetical protein